MTRLTFIPPQFVKVVQATRADLASYVVAGIYIDEGKPGVARAWKVGADGSNGGEIEFVNEGGKDDTVSAAILPSGDVRLVISEAVSGGSGSTAQPSVYLIPAVFPPAPPPSIDQGARDLANAAAKQANYATTVATQAKERADAAVSQANANANVNTAQAEQIAALDGRVSTIEGA